MTRSVGTNVDVIQLPPVVSLPIRLLRHHLAKLGGDRPQNCPRRDHHDHRQQARHFSCVLPARSQLRILVYRVLVYRVGVFSAKEGARITLIPKGRDHTLINLFKFHISSIENVINKVQYCKIYRDWPNP